MTFQDLDFKPRTDGPISLGVQARIDFPNRYGASVIRSRYSYGGEDGLYELAVMLNGSLCYDTPITSDVIGRLTPEAVTELLGQIEMLPPKEA